MALRRRRFAERRVAQGYSQEEFAEALTVAASTVIRWEGAMPHQGRTNGPRSPAC